MFEISGTPEAGVSFTPRFLTSRDLKTFELTPKECTFGRERYSAPHCLRFFNGWYYCFYLEANKPKGYEQYLVRSKDLINWESSPLNPVLAASEEDKNIAGKNLTNEELAAIASAEDKNNSDIDFCEFEGKLIINYSWGNQKGMEFLAEAVYDGSMGQFLESWFPGEIRIIGQKKEAFELKIEAPIKTWDVAVPLGNGLTGCLVWGEKNLLRFSFDRGDLWDNRIPDEIKEPGFTYANIQKLVKEKNTQEISRLTDKPYSYPYPTKLPGVRLELEMEPDFDAKTFRLEMEKAICIVEPVSGKPLSVFTSATKPVTLIR